MRVVVIGNSQVTELQGLSTDGRRMEREMEEMGRERMKNNVL